MRFVTLPPDDKASQAKPQDDALPRIERRLEAIACELDEIKVRLIELRVNSRRIRP
jgi:hypothetical protein